MIENWAQATADRIADAGSLSKGRLPFLGAADTGKTTVMYALASRLTAQCSVALGDLRLDLPFGWS
jgi:hypothetical protein